ncbi:hypothetical protein [Deinococcus marmoris]|uniref:Uncharacterized protein n=1 Tax=Deinococcus marmoris TaxID=249408 RepID=A0A1U7NR50_9DEIO|nr:hypothetical protein [Deinococcus marmoris]OLV15384.1 hypothetical protein BOO71_0015052 [Deinococcus marmoris]
MTEQLGDGFSDLCDLLWVRRTERDFSVEGVATLLTLEDETGEVGTALPPAPLPAASLLAAVADALYLNLRPRFVLEADAAACALGLLATALPGEPGEPVHRPHTGQ